MSENSTENRLTPLERRATGALAAVFALRMLGLFLIMPVIAIYGQAYPDYTPLLIGLAIGAYGLTQAVLQIPFGMLSDRIGRRPVIIGGLLLFALGSVLAAYAETLVGVILGRALQGTGAIAAAILALTADITRDSQRPKAMAMIGMSIGLSFALALVLGPLLGDLIGLRGLFLFTAVSALLGLLVFVLAVPQVRARAGRADILPQRRELGGLLRHPQLLRLNAGVFILHGLLTAFFVVVPTQLVQGGLLSAYHAWLYLPALLLSFALMLPLLIRAEKRRQQPQFFRVAILLLAAGVAAIVFIPAQWPLLLAAIVLFFAGFNFLEATLPASLTRFAPVGSKGSASGLYATAQFFGAFIGGVCGGWLQQTFGMTAVGWFALLLLACWWFFTLGMQAPPQWQDLSFQVQLGSAADADRLAERLAAVEGVAEVRVILSQQTAYLKVQKSDYNETQLAAQLAPFQPQA